MSVVTFPDSAAELDALKRRVMAKVGRRKSWTRGEELDDAFSEALVRAAAEKEIDSLEGYLIEVVSRAVVDAARKDRARRDSERAAAVTGRQARGGKTAPPLAPLPQRDVYELVEEELTEREAQAQLLGLPVAQYEAVRDRVLLSRSIDELAAAVGISPNTYTKRVLKGLRNLMRRPMAERAAKDFCPAGWELIADRYVSQEEAFRRDRMGIDVRTPVGARHLAGCNQCRMAQARFVAYCKAGLGMLPAPTAEQVLEQPQRGRGGVGAAVWEHVVEGASAARRASAALRERIIEAVERTTPGRTAEVAGAGGGSAAAGAGLASGGLSASKLAVLCATVLGFGSACYGVDTALEGTPAHPHRAIDTAAVMRDTALLLKRAAERTTLVAARQRSGRISAQVGVPALRPRSKTVAKSGGGGHSNATGSGGDGGTGGSGTASGLGGGTPEQRSAAQAGANPAQKAFGIESGASSPRSGASTPPSQSQREFGGP